MAKSYGKIAAGFKKTMQQCEQRAAHLHKKNDDDEKKRQKIETRAGNRSFEISQLAHLSRNLGKLIGDVIDD